MSAVKFPPANFAVYDASEVNGRLRFDGGAISECVWWGPFRMNSDYASTPVFKFQYSMTSATVGGVSINVSVITAAPSGDNVKTKPFTTVNNCDDTTVPAELGDYKEISCPWSTMMAWGRIDGPNSSFVASLVILRIPPTPVTLRDLLPL